MIGAAERRGSDATEIEIVRGLAAGDLDGLGLLFDRYGESIRRLVIRMGVPASDADDLVQNTFLAAMRSASRFNADYAVRSWLLGIAAMMTRRYHRSSGRLAARLRAWSHEPGVAPAQPDGASETKEQLALAERALGELSQKKREAFVMVVLEGVPGEEAAGALGIPVNTLWTRLHHARRELREALFSAATPEAVS